MIVNREILKSLSNLSQKDLKEAQARIALLIKDDANDSSDEHLVYSEMASVLKQYGEKNVAPLFLVKKANYAKAFKDGVVILAQYVDDYLMPKTKTERLKGIRILLELIVNWMRSLPSPIPLMFATLANNLHNVDVAVEGSFPYYRESGLLCALINSKRIVEID
jgi:hypothetical protein